MAKPITRASERDAIFRDPAWERESVNIWERGRARRKWFKEHDKPLSKRKKKPPAGAYDEWEPVVAHTAGSIAFDEYGNPLPSALHHDENGQVTDASGFPVFQNEEPHDLGAGMDLPTVHNQWKKWWKPYSDRGRYPAGDAITSWGNIEEFLKDHGVDAGDNEHPLSVAMQQLHGLAQGRTWRITPEERRQYRSLIHEGAKTADMAGVIGGEGDELSSPQARYVLLPHWDPQSCVDILHDHATQMGHHRIALSVTPELMDQAHHGGFTLHDHVGDAPTHGYMISLAKNSEEKVPLAHLTPQHVQNFVDKHLTDLQDPHTYLGGWLEGPTFYLDISSHRPDLDRATRDAASNHQIGIYDLDHGKTLGTDEAGYMTGVPAVVGARMAAQDQRPPVQLEIPFDQLPDHDWTQHSLGDAEHWEEEENAREQAAVEDYLKGFGPGFGTASRRVAGGPEALPGNIQYYQPGGGTHGAEVWRDPATQDNWLVKHAPKKAPYLAHLDVAANAIQQKSGLETPATFLHDFGKGPASAQWNYPNAKDAFPNKAVSPDKVSDPDLLTLQKHHALDWMLGNHDAHGGQFIRLPDGQMVGIDKGQAFKFFGNDKLHWNYHPNTVEQEPVYNTLWRNFARGGREMLDPRQGELGEFIKGLQSIPDEEYQQTLMPYAMGAAKGHELAKFSTDPNLPPNQVKAFLAAATARKNSLGHDFGKLYDKAMAHRMTGLKIAVRKVAIAPDPALMHSLNKTVGSHGSQLYQDDQGQWVIKAPNNGNEFLVPLDVATASLQRRVGLESPETYAIPFQGGMATAVKMYPNATQRFPDRPHPPPGLADLSPEEQLTIQKHHAMDWLIANHDGHVGNWLQTDKGLVGIDKGQALKYFGQDKLDYRFHPNYYARPPIYNRLWGDYAHARPGEMLDPRQGELGEFVKNIQAIPDWQLRQMFAPYAWAAANAGRLGTGAYGAGKWGPAAPDPSRGLTEPTVAPNDPGKFLDALVGRKHSLMDDLGAFYDKTSAERQYNIAHPPPPRPPAPPKPAYQPHQQPTKKDWPSPYGGKSQQSWQSSTPWFLQSDESPPKVHKHWMPTHHGPAAAPKAYDPHNNPLSKNWGPAKEPHHPEWDEED